MSPTPQSWLSRLRTEIETNTDALGALASRVDEATWRRRPEPQKWSMAEGVAHLVATTDAYLPLLAQGIALAPDLAPDPGPGASAEKRARGTLFGRLLRWLMEPPVRLRLKTTPPFVPEPIPETVEGADARRSTQVERFADGQAALRALLDQAEGKAIHRAKMSSPFDPRLRYDLLSAFRIVTAHQRRHLWIMERIETARRGP